MPHRRTPDVFVREDPALNERAELFDPSPLFLPTPMNYGAPVRAREKIAGAPARDGARSAEMDAPPLPEPKQGMPEPDGTPAPLTPRNTVLTQAYARRAPEAQLPKNSGDTFIAFGRTPPDTTAIKPAGARAILTDEVTGEPGRRNTAGADRRRAGRDDGRRQGSRARRFLCRMRRLWRLAAGAPAEFRRPGMRPETGRGDCRRARETAAETGPVHRRRNALKNRKKAKIALDDKGGGFQFAASLFSPSRVKARWSPRPGSSVGRARPW